MIIQRASCVSALYQLSVQHCGRLIPVVCTLPELNYSGQRQSRRRFHKSFGGAEDRDFGNDRTQWLKLAGLLGGATLSLLLSREKLKTQVHAAAAPSTNSARLSRNESDQKNLALYSAAEVAEHYDEEKRVWVTFREGVYDVTDFITKHPGGNRIMMAAGGSLEPFWDLYPAHRKPEVFQLLEKYRIGSLNKTDIVQPSSGSADPFMNEPKRHVALIPRSAKPCNAETPPSLLVEKFYTPNDLFYVRNHLPVPIVDLNDYRLEVGGIHVKPSSFSLEEIKKLPKFKISSAIQCAGNRRADMNEFKKTSGLEWTGGAIGNAEWGGARLRDVLKLTGFDLKKYKFPEKLHIVFEGLDSDPSGESYEASVPFSYILDGNFEPILAYEMNGQTLPHDHGFPLRIILPGIVGARNVKWLCRIEINDKESESPWQKRDYKVFGPSTTLDNVDYSSSRPIMDTPVNSYICSHDNGSILSKGKHKFRGYAHSGGGRQVIRVEVSTDKGQTWNSVDTIISEEPAGTRQWSWILWEATLEFKEAGEREIWVKAIDSSCNQQPEGFSGIWNYRGLISNAYHRLKVNVQ